MTMPSILPGDGARRRLELAAPPAQARMLLERAIAMSGGTVLTSRTGGFDFAPHGVRHPARGSVAVRVVPGGTACTIGIGWPTATLLRFTGAMLALTIALLPVSARLGPVGFAATLAVLTSFGFGRYLLALAGAALALRRLALVTQVLATSTLYRAPPTRSRLVEARALVAELCAGRITPSDFRQQRRLLLADRP